MDTQKKKLIILAGPTAAGKTAVSVSLAKRVGGEIISADSMQVYRHMDIGSAKIKEKEMENIPHHLIDVLSPKEEFNITLFQAMAKQAMALIEERGRLPILTGGTGFYIQSLLYDIDFAPEAKDEGLRTDLEEEYEKEGAKKMHQKLRLLDPDAADAIHPNNKKRVLRAIEYALSTGEKISEHNRREREKSSPYDFHYFVLSMDREKLYQRIDRRVDKMMEEGLLEEVKMLREMGLNKDFVSMQGLGYKEILSHLEGEISLERAIYLIKRDTRHFAKRQLTWFKREPEAIWIDIERFADASEIAKYLHSSFFLH